MHFSRTSRARHPHFPRFSYVSHFLHGLHVRTTCTSSARASTINPPTYSSCSSSLPGVSVAVTTSGTWGVSMQHGDPISATLTIPQGGFLLETSGLASCTVTAAPDGEAPVAATWTNGEPSQLGFTDAEVPVTVEGGFGCPTSSDVSVFNAVYEVTDVTDPAAQITVTG